jgi:phosphoglycerate dehydrogenase-like enzyme
VLLIGHGGVGRAIASRLRPFEVELVRAARTARSDSDGRIHSLGDLPELLPGAELVILAVPLTAETLHLADRRFLSAMPDGAALINVSRGPVVDTGALLAELFEGRLRAAVDVVEPEPLPGEHPLWDAPNLLITPHVGGASSAMRPRMARLLVRQMRQMLDGEPPLNLVIEGYRPGRAGS